MSTTPVDKEQRAIRRKLKKPVTRGELATLLSDWARAADASLSVKMEAMRSELVAELRPDLVTMPPSDAVAITGCELLGMKVPGNVIDMRHAPTDSEGPE